MKFLRDTDIIVEKPSHVTNIHLWDGLMEAGISSEQRVGIIIDSLLDHAHYGMAEKQDGHRVLLAGDGYGTQWLIDKLGQREVISVVNDTPLKLDAAFRLLNIGCNYIFDGEAIGGRGHWTHYVIFNVILFNDNDWTQTQQIEREFFLCSLATELEIPYETFPDLNGEVNLICLRTEADPAVKRRMYQRLTRQIPVSEGVIFREMFSPMMEGSAGEVYKFPFIFELDAVAYKWNEGSSGGPGRGGSVEIGLYHNEELKRIGGLRSGLSYDRLDYMQDHLEAGQKVVVRVRFLGKRTIGILLNQPRCEEIRTDKLAMACVARQLIELLGPGREILFDEAPSVKE